MSIEEKFSPGEIAKFHGTTRGAIYIAIKNGKLKGSFSGGKWGVSREDYQEYIKNKHSRKFTRFQGELIFDPEKGDRSVADASKILKMNIHQIYYLCRTKTLPNKKKGHSYVINIEDIMKFKDERTRYLA